MKNNPMLEALRRSKGQGLDIHILIGKPDANASANSGDDVGDGNTAPTDDPELLDEIDGYGLNDDEKDEEERRLLDMAPDAEVLGDNTPQPPSADVPADDMDNQKLFAQEMDKANFGKNSMAGRKKSSLLGKKV